MLNVRRLNHAVLYIRDVDTSVDFYTKVLGFSVVEQMPGQAAFLRAAASDNHHDIGLFAVGPNASRPERGRVGLYHLAWEVDTIDELARARQVLSDAGALTGQSDHGATKSLYAQDPDGNEFEVMWMVPREDWGEYESSAPTAPLDLERELARYGAG